jgi:hypothetical protein
MTRLRNSMVSNINIGHLDTGIDVFKYPEMKNAIEKFRLFDDIGNVVSQIPTDTGSHGTETAMLIYSLVPEARLYSAAVIDSGHIFSRMIAGLEWMLEQPIQILSIAIGFKGVSPLFEGLFERLTEKGVLIVVSSGNGGTCQAFTPAWSPHVITVGAIDVDGKPADYSSSINTEQGECIKPEILAPGDFRSYKGTSFSSSYVVGIAAEIWKKNPDLEADEIKACLVSLANPLTDNMKYKSRHGILNCEHLKVEVLPEFEVEGRSYLPINEEIKDVFVDPYLLRRMKRSQSGSTIDFLLVWKAGLDVQVLNSSIEIEVKIVNKFLDGEIIHCKADNHVIKTLLRRKDIKVIQSTFPPALV